MKISKNQLERAAQAQLISTEQARELWQFLQRQQAQQPQFNATHVLYYLGGLLAIAAMTLLMNLGWQSFGGLALIGIGLIYAVLGIILTESFRAKQLAIPAGICATFVVCLTPLVIYGLQDYLTAIPAGSDYRDYHRYVSWSWFYMEIGTLLVAALLAWRYRYGFLLMPVAVTLWYLSMDVAVMIYGQDLNWDLRKQVSMYVGLAMIALALWVDIRSRHLAQADYAFWLYLFGALAFWGGLSLQESDSELAKATFFVINLLMIGVGVLLARRVFVVLGGLGSFGYLGYLSYQVFADSWLFPLLLTVIGLFVIYLGVVWQKHEARINARCRAWLPLAWQRWLKQ
ncbi:hypothetical protein [Idiomarina xiamenensis]|uniref:DUF2157 domain-containing protein n=1 Tax=Idiomarina xiamenensis 10-D-4 TaxID=740709 RepID=K2K8H2_9GAMM|nr:hypothetical protein [Idiomarina xiamenensis]EKE82882.1 hypothetical protein A10D4_08584 [Idiomarina xiamenensis 10-D-4]